jgi:hypothetical protein
VTEAELHACESRKELVPCDYGGASPSDVSRIAMSDRVLEDEVAGQAHGLPH